MSSAESIQSPPRPEATSSSEVSPSQTSVSPNGMVSGEKESASDTSARSGQRVPKVTLGTIAVEEYEVEESWKDWAKGVDPRNIIPDMVVANSDEKQPAGVPPAGYSNE